MTPDAPSQPELSSLPEPIPADRLRELSDSDLEGVTAPLQNAVRAVTAAMAPFEQQLREVRARLAEVATERRRRERAAHVAQRSSVREQAKTGQMPALIDALAGGLLPDETALRDVHAFLATGGQVAFGFATRPGTITFTDGRQQRQAQTWGEARELHELGWDPGTPVIAGVRIHLAGTRVERVVSANEVVVQPP
jgi:hypothetical protein